MSTLVEVKEIKKYFPVRTGLLRRPTSFVHAVDGVSFHIRRGETFSLVGESGCGKTTLGNCILRILEPTGGNVIFDGRDITKLGAKDMREYRSRMQIVFQNPYSSLNPKRTIRQILSDPFLLHDKGGRDEVDGKVLRLLERVGLGPEHIYRYPYEFSGGQRQRIAVARAIAVDPEFVFLDEPTSSLDVSVQAQILNLLQDLQEEYELTYLLVTHNIDLVKYFADRVAVMYLGKIMELGSKAEIFENPLHPYTLALFSAVPSTDPEIRKERIPLRGEVLTPIDPAPGCRFYGRCWMAEKGLCDVEEPPLRGIGGEHYVACHFAEQQIEAAKNAGERLKPTPVSSRRRSILSRAETQ